MILLDTNIVSEFMKAKPHPDVLAWAQSIPPQDLVISAITVMEIGYGLAILPEGARRRGVMDAWESTRRAFAGAIIPFDTAAAAATAEILARGRISGTAVAAGDAKIAGIALSRNHRLATRNTADFAAIAGLELINPFGAA